MSKKNIVKNYFFNAGYQLLALIVPLVTTPYISRTLSVSGIGVYSYTYSIVSYFTLFATLGTVTYGNKIFGILQDNIIERTKRFWDIFILRLILSIITLFLYIFYVVFFSEYRIIATIQCLYIISVMVDISWFFQGLEEFKKIAIRNYIIKIINIIYVFVFVKTSEDLWKYVFGLAFLTFIGNVSIWIYLPKYITSINKYRPNPFIDFKVIMQLFIPTTAIQIYAILDKTMIGYFSDFPVENGYYEQSEKIVKMCLMLITSLSTVMIPRISKAFAENKVKEILEEIYNSYNFVWFLSIPFFFGLIGISPILVPVFFGNGYEKVIYLLPIFSVLFIVMGLNYTTGSQLFITTGKQNIYTKYIIIGGTVNIILNLLLVPKLLAIGAAISSVTGEIVIMVLEMKYIKKYKNLDVSHIFKLSRIYVFSGFFMFIYIIILRSFLSICVISLLSIIFSAGVIYFIILLIFKEKFIFQGLNIIKSKIIH